MATNRTFNVPTCSLAPCKAAVPHVNKHPGRPNRSGLNWRDPAVKREYALKYWRTQLRAKRAKRQRAYNTYMRKYMREYRRQKRAAI